MNPITLHDRLVLAAGERTYKQLAELTGQNQETVRRYMQGNAPSVEFIAAFGNSLGLNGSWLLTGHGPMRLGEVRTEALREADVSELLTAMADTLSQLINRVERLEVFLQTLETRLRTVRRPAVRVVKETPGGTDDRDHDIDISVRAGRIGRVASERPHTDDA